jgi:uncharacterized protein YegL
LIKDGENSKAFVFFAVGVGGADLNILRQIVVDREPLKLQGLKFRELFKWLSIRWEGFLVLLRVQLFH